jgi:hypothetical protein
LSGRKFLGVLLAFPLEAEVKRLNTQTIHSNVIRVYVWSKSLISVEFVLSYEHRGGKPVKSSEKCFQWGWTAQSKKFLKAAALFQNHKSFQYIASERASNPTHNASGRSCRIPVELNKKKQARGQSFAKQVKVTLPAQQEVMLISSRGISGLVGLIRFKSH